MEQNFQTSFIPKKPMIEERAVSKAPVGIFTILSIFIFIAVVLASGGLYLYKGVLTKNITQMKNDLELAQSSFEPSVIAQMQVLDKRLRAADSILANHIAVSPIFQALQEITLKTIRFTKFSYDFSTDKENKIMVQMSGQAVGYRAIAQQADLLSTNKNLIDPIFSNLTLDDKGNVLFDLDFSVASDFVDYKKVLLTESNNSSFDTGQSTGTETIN
jgi:hypothetical protein